ncbi:MAG TPA: Holliday junction branch migration protein RuvA [bacterium]
MISFLRGILFKKDSGIIVVDVGGVGYEVMIPLSTFYKLPESGEEVSLEIVMHVSDNSMELYGFLSTIDKKIFKILTLVPGIGPKLARSILSGIEANELKIAIARNDVVRLRSIPKVGAKLAEKIILELKDKIPPLLPEEEKEKVYSNAIVNDLMSALVGLGYKRFQIEDVVKSVMRNNKEKQELGPLLKEALRQLSL